MHKKPVDFVAECLKNAFMMALMITILALFSILKSQGDPLLLLVIFIVGFFIFFFLMLKDSI